VNDNIEEYEVSNYSTEECEEDSIEDLFAFTLRLIKGTDALRAKVPHQSKYE
jgi:hypothetical protein